jgi:hypothetical protein
LLRLTFMTGVLHPVGPERSQTYWLRRAVVLAAVVLVLAVFVGLVNGSAADGQQKAVPAADATASPVWTPTTPAATQSAGPDPASTDSASTGSARTGSGATGSGEESTAPSEKTGSDKDDDEFNPGPPNYPFSRPTESDPSASSTSKSHSTEQSGEFDELSTNDSSSSEPSAAAAESEPSKPTPCPAADLRTTLRGDQTLKVKQDNTFTLSLINGGSSRCVIEVTAATFELKIFSGIDRIWTTKHCPSAVTPIKKTVRSEDAVEWKLTWDGLRSADGCKDRPEVPRPGTYFATAQFDGAEPVQLRMAVTA